MKWSEEQVNKLKELCYVGVSNKEIAVQLNCNVTDVYNKRSQLIDKCKAAAADQQQVERPGLSTPIIDKFVDLQTLALAEATKKATSFERSIIYNQMADELLKLSTKYNKCLKRVL